MVEGKNISKSFGDLQVLKNIDISIASGEIVTILGASGAGRLCVSVSPAAAGVYGT